MLELQARNDRMIIQRVASLLEAVRNASAIDDDIAHLNTPSSTSGSSAPASPSRLSLLSARFVRASTSTPPATFSGP
jgi:hypothetical protein